MLLVVNGDNLRPFGAKCKATVSQQRINTLPDKLIKLALEVQKNAYAPYSNFHVGASLLGADGNTYSACNVENAAYPLGQCAEASAIGTMVASGCKSIKAVVVASPNQEFCYPCGGCRQKLAEFTDADTPVTMVTQDGKEHTVTMAELLPYSFGPKDLGK